MPTKKPSPAAQRQRASRANRIKEGGMPISGTLDAQAAEDMRAITGVIGCTKITAIHIALRHYVTSRLIQPKR